MKKTSVNPSSSTTHQALCKTGLLNQLTFSVRLRESFELPDEMIASEWPDSNPTAGRVHGVELISFPNGSDKPVDPLIALIRASLPEEVLDVPVLVLIVEDDPKIGKLVLQIIRQLGFGAAWIRDAEAGWDSVLQNLPKVVLTDMDMPQFGGLELCRRIKAHPKTQNIPVVILSGDATDEISAREAGAAEFLTKPVEVARLILCLLRLTGG